MLYTLLLYGMTAGAVLPAAMNVKSDKALAAQIAASLPKNSDVYAFRPDSMGMSRYYVLGFYMADRMHLFDVEKPQNGYLVIGEDDFEAFRTNEGQDYEFVPLIHTSARSHESRQRMLVLRFNARQNFGSDLVALE